MGRKITQYPNNVSVTPDELSLIDVSEKTGVAVYESRKWTLTQFKAWLNANLTIPSVDGTQGQIPLFVQDDVIGSNTRFTFIDNEGTEVGFRFSDSAGNLTQAGVTYLNVESQGIASNSVLRLANWADNTNKGVVQFRKSRGSKTTPTGVLNGDILGAFIASGQHNNNAGTTTFEMNVVAKQDYAVDLVNYYPEIFRYALTELQVKLASSADSGFLNPPFSNNLVLTIDGNGKVSFKNYTFPIADGTANQVLKTNGAGQLSWSTPSSGVNGSGVNERLAIWTGSNNVSYKNSFKFSTFDNSDYITIDNTASSNVSGRNLTELGLVSGFNQESNGYSQLKLHSSGGLYPILTLSKGQGTITNKSPYLNNDTLGVLRFGFTDVIRAYATQNQASGSGVDIVFKSGVQGGTIGDDQEVIRLKDSGHLRIANQYNLPKVDGLANQVLTTNGAGQLSWTTPSSTSDFIPRLQGNETFRGVTHRNNSVTFDTYGGITMNITGAQFAKSVATTNFQSKQVVSSYSPTATAVGAYGCIRGANALHASGAGFYFVCEYGIADTAYAPNTHNFVGLTTSTTALAIGGSGNGQPSAITSTFLAMANDSTDANMQIMYRNISNQIVKIDLGANFPSNRGVSVPANGIYRVEFYNFTSSSLIRYRVTHYTTTNGNFEATGFLTDLNYLDLLTFQVGRSMGTQLGGVTNSAIFVVGRCGIYNV